MRGSGAYGIPERARALLDTFLRARASACAAAKRHCRQAHAGAGHEELGCIVPRTLASLSNYDRHSGRGAPAEKIFKLGINQVCARANPREGDESLQAQ